MRLAASLACAVALFAHGEPASACSCVEPEPQLLSPGSVGLSPLNARVRVALPGPGTGAGPHQIVLRARGGSAVAVKRTESVLSSRVYVELVPASPLAPDTRYEVALVVKDRRPGTLVFGTFETGAETDTAPPTGGTLGKPEVYKTSPWSGTSCSIGTPWVSIPVTARGSDPRHVGVRPLYAVWAADASGRLDTGGPATTFLHPSEGALTLGKTSYCDPDDFPLPRRGRLTIGVALIDDAGNRGVVQRMVIDVSAARAYPSRRR